jgi:serine/threonine protein kinase
MASNDFEEYYELDKTQPLIGSGFGKRLEAKLKKDRDISGSTLKAGTQVVVHQLEKRNLTAKQSKAIQSSFDTLRKLKDHQNVKHLIEVFEDDKQITVIKEYVGGTKLIDMIDQFGPFSEKEASSIIKQVMSVIDEMNKQGLTHRGLTVDGILLVEDAETGKNYVKLSEFQASGPVADSLDPGVFLRTANEPPHCVAPEVLIADVPFTEKVDWWSIGVITYTLLYGVYPFYDPNDAVVIQNILAANYSFHEEISVSAEAKDFVAKLLEVEVSARASAAECWAHPWLNDKKTKYELSGYTNRI